YSPAAEKPCTIRTTNSRNGANSPTCSYPGRMATTTVEQDMMMMDRESAARLPLRSPNLPQKTPPRGRTMKETAKTAKVDSSAAVCEVFGKKTVASVVAR